MHAALRSAAVHAALGRVGQALQQPLQLLFSGGLLLRQGQRQRAGAAAGVLARQGVEHLEAGRGRRAGAACTRLHSASAQARSHSPLGRHAC